MTAAALIADHRAAGREFSAAGVPSFVRCEGSGDAVLCLHGIPASSFLYRKVLPELARRGLCGVAFDLPGLGLAARPASFSYTWTGHGAWCAAAVDELRLDTFHLVVHDYGGPVGFELCAHAPGRVRSLTILNTVVDVEAFHRPWLVELLARRGIGEVVLQAVPRIVFRTLLTRLGIGDPRGITDAELDAWLDLLRGTDRGRALLRMARDLERTREKRDLYMTTLRELTVPVQIVWGADDSILRVEVHGEQARAATGAPIHLLAAKHFLQEDLPAAVAEHVWRLARTAPGDS